MINDQEAVEPWSDVIVKDVETQVLALAADILKGYASQARLDVANFLENSRVSLQIWAGMLAKGG